MNMNNWLSFPVSPTQPSFNNHPSLGLLNDDSHQPFQTQEWNMIDSNVGDEVPKVADFLGMAKPENTSEFSSFNQIQATDTSYMLTNCTHQSAENSTAGGVEDYNCQENASNLQSLTLSMGSGKGLTGESSGVNAIEVAPRRAADTFGQRTSIYRGVTRHRWTGRYEAHLWDNSCRREGQSRKGRQVYLGGYDKEEKAARAYDLAALKYWGTSTTTNFPISTYEREVEEMKHMTRQEFVASLRRKSSGFSRGASMYRGVTRHHQHGRWQARIGRVAGNKDLYLGTFSTEEEAAEAYDIAAIKFRGLNAVTNFDMSRYDVHSIMESNTLPIGGGASKRLKESEAMEARKREEIKGVGSSFLEPFQFHGYPLLPAFDQQSPQPQQQQQQLQFMNPQLHQTYLVNQQHQPPWLQSDSYLQAHQPNSAHNFVTPAGPSCIGPSASSSNSYCGGHFGDGFVTVPNSAVLPGLKPENMDLGDYEMGSGSGYGDWSMDPNRGPSHGLFSMWNDDQ